MRAAAVQFKPDKDDPQGSRLALAALAARAAEDADLVVLPEMAAAGYHFTEREQVEARAEVATGPSFRAWSRIARTHRTWIVGGLPERAIDRGDPRLYNSALVIDPRGDLAFVYRKTLLYEADLVWAAPGNTGYRFFDTAQGRFGVGICMDMNDPRFVLWCWRSGLDALAFPTNWVDEGTDVWPYWRARIGGSGATLVAANTYGRDGDMRFSGRSAILHDRTVVAAAGRHGDAVVFGPVGAAADAWSREARRSAATRP